MQNNQISDELLMAKLTPEAISNTWPELRKVIELSLPPVKSPGQNANRMTYILESLLIGKLSCYSFYEMREGLPFAYGVCVTSVITSVEGIQNLLIYAAYGHSKYIGGDSRITFFNKMKEIARMERCENIILYSSIPAIIETVKSVGGSADYRLLIMEV